MPAQPLTFPQHESAEDDCISPEEGLRRNEIVRATLPLGLEFDPEQEENDEEDYLDATWLEVYDTCCFHIQEHGPILTLYFFGVCVCLYFFMLGLELVASGSKVMGGCKAGELFGEQTNPVASLMVGILSTVLLQSSSTTTSIIVSLVGSTISVDQGIYMIMGTNIGTSITNTIVAMGQVGSADQLERAFAGATVHDLFNFMSVALLFPVELATGYLEHLTEAMTKNATVNNDDEWEGPIKKFVTPLGHLVIIANKNVTRTVAKDEASCEDFYPNSCDPSVDPPTYDSCESHFGLVACDKDTRKCPAFFQPNATASDDKVSGGVVFFIGIVITFICLLGIVAILQRMLLGLSTRIIIKATDMNGYVAIILGAGITMVVQSSSITTSTLTPLVGMGAIRLEQMFPLTLGANIGTTITGIMAALVSDSIKSLRVALAHLMFNITGILLFYPIPRIRNIPMSCARRLGEATRVWRGFPLVYIIVMFFLIPLIVLALSTLIEKDSVGYKALGSFLVVLFVTSIAYIVYWCLHLDGREKSLIFVRSVERHREAYRNLPADIEYLKTKVQLLIEHTGLDESKSCEHQESEALFASTTEEDANP